MVDCTSQLTLPFLGTTACVRQAGPGLVPNRSQRLRVPKMERVTAVDGPGVSTWRVRRSAGVPPLLTALFRPGGAASPFLLTSSLFLCGGLLTALLGGALGTRSRPHFCRRSASLAASCLGDGFLAAAYCIGPHAAPRSFSSAESGLTAAARGLVDARDRQQREPHDERAPRCRGGVTTSDPGRSRRPRHCQGGEDLDPSSGVFRKVWTVALSFLKSSGWRRAGRASARTEVGEDVGGDVLGVCVTNAHARRRMAHGLDDDARTLVAQAKGAPRRRTRAWGLDVRPRAGEVTADQCRAREMSRRRRAGDDAQPVESMRMKVGSVEAGGAEEELAATLRHGQGARKDLRWPLQRDLRSWPAVTCPHPRSGRR